MTTPLLATIAAAHSTARILEGQLEAIANSFPPHSRERIEIRDMEGKTWLAAAKLKALGDRTSALSTQDSPASGQKP